MQCRSDFKENFRLKNPTTSAYNQTYQKKEEQMLVKKKKQHLRSKEIYNFYDTTNMIRFRCCFSYKLLSILSSDEYRIEKSTF